MKSKSVNGTPRNGYSHNLFTKVSASGVGRPYARNVLKKEGTHVFWNCEGTKGVTLLFEKGAGLLKILRQLPILGERARTYPSLLLERSQRMMTLTRLQALFGEFPFLIGILGSCMTARQAFVVESSPLQQWNSRRLIERNRKME